MNHDNRHDEYDEIDDEYPEQGEFLVRVKLTAELKEKTGFPLLEVAVGYRPDTKILFREAGVVEVTSGDEQVLEFRGRLENLYSQSAQGMGTDERRRRKAELFAVFQDELAALAVGGNQTYSAWVGRALGNADLASIGFYREHLEAFADLREASGSDLDAFYASVGCLAALDAAERRRRLEERSWGECILGRS